MQHLVDDKQAMRRSETARRLLSALTHRSESAADLGLGVAISMSKQYPGIAAPQVSKVQAFEIIARVRKRIMAAKIKADSIKDYKKKADHLLSTVDAADEPNEAARWIKALDSYAGQANSFKGNKAAACWYLRQDLKDLLTRQDHYQRTDEFEDSWLRCVKLIAEKEEIYEEVYAHIRQIPRPVDGLSLPTGESKKRDLKVIAKKYPNWIALMRDGASATKYVDAQRALELIGCRPEELEQGIMVTQSGPANVTFTVTGAKVTKFAGQPWRKISLPLSRLCDEWIGRLQKLDSFIVKIDSKDGLRNSLQRVSSRVLKGVPFATAYVYRHSFATMLRDSGHTMEEIGELMGHSVAETQMQYGLRKGGGRKVKPVKGSGYSADVPREVRASKVNGLQLVLAKKKSIKIKAG